MPHLKRGRLAVLALALSAATLAAQAAITTAPDLPATVSIAKVGDGTWSFEALGSARLDNGQWTAAIVDVGHGTLMVDPAAQLRLRVGNDFFAELPRITWHNLAITHDPAASGDAARLSGDMYVDGTLKMTRAHMAFLGLPGQQGGDLPEGQELLYSSNGSLGGLAVYGLMTTAQWDPQAFAQVTVSSVPEPGSWMLMGLGLAGLVTGVRRARRRVV